MAVGDAARGFGLGAGRLALAVYVALLLPFVCWGAAATPGHPHARPHIVFLAPPAATVEAFARAEGLTAAELVAHFADRSLCGGDHAAVTHTAGAKPAGRSVPAILGFTLLVISLLAAVLLEPRHRPGIERLFGMVAARTVFLPLATPPPRVAA